MNLVLRPGEQVPQHTAPVDVFFYVVEGEGSIRIGEKEFSVQPTDIVTCPANTPMAVRAGETGLSVLNIKTPSPDYEG